MLIQKIRYGIKTADMTVDGENYKVSLEVLSRHGFKVLQELEIAQFEEFLIESDQANTLDYLLAMLARAPRSEQEARNTLREKGYKYTSVRNAIEKVKKVGFLDDRKFAESFILGASKEKGISLIRTELQNKGVDQEIIESELEKAKVNESDVCINVMGKYMNGKRYNDTKTMERLIRFLIARGFSADSIKVALPLNEINIEGYMNNSDS
ncbi:MAG: recombination regulator RecX [Christensenellaceae bacterium]|jgi:regulatory protein|nr:recombination regulator RecX [Christensenellaceae bacterium]